MKYFHNILLVSLLCILFANCKKDEAEAEVVSFIGGWEWIETSGGVEGVVLTPENTGSYERMYISDTYVSRVKDGEVVFAQMYQIVENHEVIEGGIKTVFIYDNKSFQSLEIVDGILILRDQVHDYYTYKYIKLKD